MALVVFKQSPTSNIWLLISTNYARILVSCHHVHPESNTDAPGSMPGWSAKQGSSSTWRSTLTPIYDLRLEQDPLTTMPKRILVSIRAEKFRAIVQLKHGQSQQSSRIFSISTSVIAHMSRMSPPHRNKILAEA
jgi:hypothetical protein